MGISGEFCAEDTACAKALGGEEAWGAFSLEESSQAGWVGGAPWLGESWGGGRPTSQGLLSLSQRVSCVLGASGWCQGYRCGLWHQAA